MKDRILAQLHSQWGQFFSGTYNWYEFSVIRVEFERDIMINGYSFDIIILGFGLHVRINTKKGLQQLKELTEE